MPGEARVRVCVGSVSGTVLAVCVVAGGSQQFKLWLIFNTHTGRNEVALAPAVQATTLATVTSTAHSLEQFIQTDLALSVASREHQREP